MQISMHTQSCGEKPQLEMSSTSWRLNMMVGRSRGAGK